jgi:hypothetical protein
VPVRRYLTNMCCAHGTATPGARRPLQIAFVETFGMNQPDTVSKNLTSLIPLGCCCARGDVQRSFKRRFRFRCIRFRGNIAISRVTRSTSTLHHLSALQYPHLGYCAAPCRIGPPLRRPRQPATSTPVFHAAARVERPRIVVLASWVRVRKSRRRRSIQPRCFCRSCTPQPC